MGSKLFVGNLSFKTTGDDLKQLFGQVGTCTSATVMTERETGRSRGFAFVEMSSGEEATAAITKFNGHEFEGRRLNVTEARERTPGPRPGGPPRFSPGGGGGGRASARVPVRERICGIAEDSFGAEAKTDRTQAHRIEGKRAQIRCHALAAPVSSNTPASVSDTM